MICLIMTKTLIKNKLRELNMQGKFAKTAIMFVSVYVLLFTGCSSKPKGKFTAEEMENIPLVTRQQLPAPTGGMSLSVDDQTITAGEVILPIADQVSDIAVISDYNTFRAKVAPVVERQLINKITDVLLYNQAKKTAPENIDDMLEKVVEAEVNKFVARYNGDRALAQEALRKMGMKDWGEFRKYQRRFILTQSYISEKLDNDKPITHAQMLEYYQKNKQELFSWTGSFSFMLIDLPYENQNRDKVKETVDTVYDKLDQGTPFAELAQQYSEGHRSQIGGLWEDVSLNSLAEPYDMIEKSAKQMSPGEVSKPIDTGSRFFIVKLVEYIEPGVEPFEKVQGIVEESIRFQRKRDNFNNMVAKLMDQAQIGNFQAFLEYCLRSAYMKYRTEG